MPKSILTFAACAAMALVASSAGAEETDLTVTLADGVITPQVVKVPADQEFTLVVANTGKSAAEFESKQLHIEKVVAPGTTVTVNVQALPAGSYKFVEEYHEDEASARGVIEAE